MVRTVVLEVLDHVYGRLEELSRFFGQDVDATVLDLLNSLSRSGRRLMGLGENYRPVPISLSHLLTGLAALSVNQAQEMDKIPQLFGAKQSYILSGFEADPDRDHFLFSYSAVPGCNLAVDQFDLVMDKGQKTLITHSRLKSETVAAQTLTKIEKTIKKTKPKEFQNLTDFNFYLEEDQQHYTLDIICKAESTNDFPKIHQISQTIKHIFRQAGLTQKNPTP